MADKDGMAGLADLSAKVKRGRQVLLSQLKLFESKLLDFSGGLGCSGNSKTVTISTWHHEESGFSGGHVAWLFFDGVKLLVRTEGYSDSGHDFSHENHELDMAKPSWLALLSAPEYLESLVADLSRTLAEENCRYASANQWLTEFVTAENEVIDRDLEASFSPYSVLLESWGKARASVVSDPEDSIARSCAHLETVIKACLKRLGDTGYETEALVKLINRVGNKLHDGQAVDSGVLQMLGGLKGIFHGIGTIRNSSSTAHGKNEGYTVPGVEVAQLINHLAGVGSAFLLKKAEMIAKRE